MYTFKTPEWFTPQPLFDELNAEFRFTLDPCATTENAKCKKFFTQEQDGLAQDWSGERVFCNPPYGRTIGKWVEKLATGGAKLAVALLPSRTDTRWFHDHIWGKAEIRFVKGRIYFDSAESARSPAPFPSMIVIYQNLYEIPTTEV